MLEALRRAQRLGLLGARPVEEVVEHARAFVRAIATLGATATTVGTHPSAAVTPTVLDIGTGGGIPGLVVASDRPDLAVTLVDRRQKCTDFLERTTAAFGWRDRVTVRCCDTTALIIAGERFDAVMARGFGPPELTLEVATQLVGPGGRIVISEPPDGDRWSSDQLERLGLSHHRAGAVAVFDAIVPA